MKVGDVIVRAYTWPSIVPGIIVDEEIEIYTSSDESESYEMCHFTVQWSDGSQTREMYEELDLFLDDSFV